MNKFITINPTNCSIIGGNNAHKRCQFFEYISHNGSVIGSHCLESGKSWLNQHVHNCPLNDRNSLPDDLPDASSCSSDYDDDNVTNLSVDVWGGAGPDCNIGWSKASKKQKKEVLNG